MGMGMGNERTESNINTMDVDWRRIIEGLFSDSVKP
jgi:hypothetical protein